MIPVRLKKEPPEFDAKVRKRGQAWLHEQGIAADSAPPEPADLPPLWREFNETLWSTYKGQCAYLAIFFEYASGAATTDHFIAKSDHAGQAYEWNNYRLACLGANRRKNRFADVLDPVGLKKETFLLNFASGEIRPNPKHAKSIQTAAHETITRLGLNDKCHTEMRMRHFGQYVRHKDEKTLKDLSPFVWQEAVRQGLL